MTIKLSTKEFKALVEETVWDAFNIPSNHEIDFNFSYSGVEIVTSPPKESEPKQPDKLDEIPF